MSQKHSVKIVIANDAENAVIEPLTFTAEGKSIIAAVGNAMLWVRNNLTAQFKAPIVHIADVQLDKADVNTIRRSDTLNNQSNYIMKFEGIRNKIVGYLALTSEEVGVEYIRATDQTKLFAGTKEFTPQQIAAQVGEVSRKISTSLKWIKADAKASVYTPEEALKISQRTEIEKQKRLEAKKAAAVLKAAAAVLKTVAAPAKAPAVAE